MDTDRLLLIVEDDEAFARTLARSFERRGYQVLHAEGIARMEELLAVHTPRYAVVDPSSRAKPTVWPACAPCTRTARKCASWC